MKAAESLSFPDCIIMTQSLIWDYKCLRNSQSFNYLANQTCLKGKLDNYRYHYKYSLVLQILLVFFKQIKALHCTHLISPKSKCKCSFSLNAGSLCHDPLAHMHAAARVQKSAQKKVTGNKLCLQETVGTIANWENKVLWVLIQSINELLLTSSRVQVGYDFKLT